MARQEQDREKVAAIGQPAEGRGTLPEPEFAGEYERTAVDDDIITGEDQDEVEEESPRGWSGEES